ncbi:MAG TPA: DUF1893 domain-containing protein [Smithellaceae bacterium]|nr:DUF1893 domain-containing protein [Smithellaceae bacterium]
MLTPDFSRYSLALLQGDIFLHSSTGSGLRPLWEALEKYSDRSGLMLHDKVMGLAAARLIERSGIINEVCAEVASLPAKQFLKECGIRLTAFKLVKNILAKDHSRICPGEIIALYTGEPDAFYRKIKEMLDSQATS